jgi:hypothetical protein
MHPHVKADLGWRFATAAGQHSHLDEDHRRAGVPCRAYLPAESGDHGGVHRDIYPLLVEGASGEAEIPLHVHHYEGRVAGFDQLLKGRINLPAIDL